MATNTTDAPPTDGSELSPDYGMKDFGIVKIYVDISGVTGYSTPRMARNADGLRTLVNQIQAALAYMTEQEALYNAQFAAKIEAEQVTAAIEAERAAARHRKGRKS